MFSNYLASGMEFADKFSDRIYATSITIGEKVASKAGGGVEQGINFADKFSDKIYNSSVTLGEKMKNNVDQLNPNVLNDTVINGQKFLSTLRQSKH